jgi:hypothetical protein
MFLPNPGPPTGKSSGSGIPGWNDDKIVTKNDKAEAAGAAEIAAATPQPVTTADPLASGGLDWPETV